ncbi:MAG: DUF5317 domain-containing protein [Actinomycetota bacterium]
MILFAAVILLAFLLGYVFGGRVRRFEQLHLRWSWLAVAGLALQFVPLPDGATGTDLVVRTAVLSCSYVLLLVFAALNIRLAGVPLVFAGLALNLLVIASNGGMPVSRGALESSGQGDVLQVLIDEGAAKHHLLTDDDVLTPLADVIPVGGPIKQVVSLGDVFVYAGVVWLIVAVMRGRIPQTSRAGPRSKRGAHRKRRASTR